MPLELMIALILVLPVLIVFGIFVWYLNIGGVSVAANDIRHKEIDNRKNIINGKA